MIDACQRALAECTAQEQGTVGGYVAAQRLRASMLKKELAGHRADLDVLAAQIIEMETALRGKARERRARMKAGVAGPTASPRRAGRRLGFLAATMAALALLLAAATPVANAVTTIPSLFGQDADVIEVDVRTLNLPPTPQPWTATPTPAFDG